jgi:phage terminase Nu1 subunit (DNA packaging protein)
MQISYNQLTELTGFSYRTIKKRIGGRLRPVGVGPSGANLWESTEALPLIYESTPGGQAEQPAGQATSHHDRYEKIRADLLELKYKRLSGELIPAADIRVRWARIANAVKTRFLGLADRLAQMLETTSTQDERREMIDSEIRQILISLGAADGSD